MKEFEREIRAVAGDLATLMAQRFSDPLSKVKDSLEKLVDALDQHIAESTGPARLEWGELQHVRHQLAQGYLRTREVAHLASGFTAALSERDVAALCDLNELLESALFLVKPAIPDEVEVFVDTSTLDKLEIPPGPATLVFAKSILLCLESLGAVKGSALSIRTEQKKRSSGMKQIFVSISDNGNGTEEILGETHRSVGSLCQALGIEYSVASVPEQGTAIELVFVS